MKALTICQPYAHLIVTPTTELSNGDVPKRVENRRWATDYRGDLIIHAGKSKRWDPAGIYQERYPDMAWGAAVGVARLAACIPRTWDSEEDGRKLLATSPWQWIVDHVHASGPYCFVLTDVERFEHPVRLRGQQGLFNAEGDWVEIVARLRRTRKQIHVRQDGRRAIDLQIGG